MRLYGRKWGIVVATGIVFAMLDFWRNEGPENLQPPKLIADVTAWLPFYGWIILALIFALGLTFEGAHREFTKVIKVSNKELRDHLAIYAISGDAILSHIHVAARTPEPTPSWDEIQEWDHEVVGYLQSNLGNDYAVRFGSHAGLPTGFTSLRGEFSSAETQIKTRLARLNEFMKELATNQQ